jgi:hypothetical protein
MALLKRMAGPEKPRSYLIWAVRREASAKVTL